MFKTIIKQLYKYENETLETKICNLHFKNPVGLAAGLDKDAEVFDSFALFGFGFIEVGTVTPEPQTGNQKPRLFRLVNEQALINRMGFNNNGVKRLIEKIKKRKNDIVIGINIGKNKTTRNENAVSDYLFCIKELYKYADYFAVNVSSPNTPNLRELQEKEPLLNILMQLKKFTLDQNVVKPIFLKISPDLIESQLDDIIEVVEQASIDGIIATNTTISRNNLITDSKVVEKLGSGGLSGKPLREISTNFVKYITNKSNGKIPIIGVGGIMNEDDAIEKFEAGAKLIQIYTGFIYEGPSLVKRINKKIIKLNTKVK